MTNKQAWNYYNGGKIEKIIMNPNDYERFKRMEGDSKVMVDNSKEMQEMDKLNKELEQRYPMKAEKESKDNYGRSGDDELFENEEIKRAVLSEDSLLEESELFDKELLFEEAVREDYQYSFLDAFRFLMKGHTIKFANAKYRKFKLIDEQIVELREFQGFSPKSMLRDKFYVEDKE